MPTTTARAGADGDPLLGGLGLTERHRVGEERPAGLDGSVGEQQHAGHREGQQRAPEEQRGPSTASEPASVETGAAPEVARTITATSAAATTVSVRPSWVRPRTRSGSSASSSTDTHAPPSTISTGASAP